MYLEIKNNSDNDFIFNWYDSWRKEGFFVATVGNAAQDYLSERTFSLSDLAYCSPVTFANVTDSSDYKHLFDNSDALSQLEKYTQVLTASCAKKQLYVLSEIEDICAANQCCELANNTGDEGFSVLITHQKSKTFNYFSKVQTAFEHVIFLPDDATYTGEILNWIICGFSKPGFVGVDYADALSVLTSYEESFCRKITYKNGYIQKTAIRDFLKQHSITCNKESEALDHLLGVWVPYSFGLDDVELIAKETQNFFPAGNIIITALFNDDENDKSWTISLLSGVSKKPKYKKCYTTRR